MRTLVLTALSSGLPRQPAAELIGNDCRLCCSSSGVQCRHRNNYAHATDRALTHGKGSERWTIAHSCSSYRRYPVCPSGDQAKVLAGLSLPKSQFKSPTPLLTLVSLLYLGQQSVRRHWYLCNRVAADCAGMTLAAQILKHHFHYVQKVPHVLGKPIWRKSCCAAWHRARRQATTVVSICTELSVLNLVHLPCWLACRR